eukprot:g4741.t1
MLGAGTVGVSAFAEKMKVKAHTALEHSSTSGVSNGRRSEQQQASSSLAAVSKEQRSDDVDGDKDKVKEDPERNKKKINWCVLMGIGIACAIVVTLLLIAIKLFCCRASGVSDANAQLGGGRDDPTRSSHRRRGSESDSSAGGWWAGDSTSSAGEEPHAASSSSHLPQQSSASNKNLFRLESPFDLKTNPTDRTADRKKVKTVTPQEVEDFLKAEGFSPAMRMRFRDMRQLRISMNKTPNLADQALCDMMSVNLEDFKTDPELLESWLAINVPKAAAAGAGVSSSTPRLFNFTQGQQGRGPDHDVAMHYCVMSFLTTRAGFSVRFAKQVAEEAAPLRGSKAPASRDRDGILASSGVGSSSFDGGHGSFFNSKWLKGDVDPLQRTRDRQILFDGLGFADPFDGAQHSSSGVLGLPASFLEWVTLRATCELERHALAWFLFLEANFSIHFAERMAYVLSAPSQRPEESGTISRADAESLECLCVCAGVDASLASSSKAAPFGQGERERVVALKKYLLKSKVRSYCQPDVENLKLQLRRELSEETAQLSAEATNKKAVRQHLERIGFRGDNVLKKLSAKIAGDIAAGNGKAGTASASKRAALPRRDEVPYLSHMRDGVNKKVLEQELGFSLTDEVFNFSAAGANELSLPPGSLLARMSSGGVHLDVSTNEAVADAGSTTNKNNSSGTSEAELLREMAANSCALREKAAADAELFELWVALRVAKLGERKKRAERILERRAGRRQKPEGERVEQFLLGVG